MLFDKSSTERKIDMKTIISIILIVATIVTATLTNVVLVTNGEVFATRAKRSGSHWWANIHAC